ADRDGRAAWTAQGDGGYLQDAVVGAGGFRHRCGARLSACAGTRRAGDGRRSREIPALVEARSPGRVREFPPVGFLEVRPRRALLLQTPAEGRIRRDVRAGEALGPRPVS